MICANCVYMYKISVAWEIRKWWMFCRIILSLDVVLCFMSRLPGLTLRSTSRTPRIDYLIFLCSISHCRGVTSTKNIRIINICICNVFGVCTHQRNSVCFRMSVNYSFLFLSFFFLFHSFFFLFLFFLFLSFFLSDIQSCDCCHLPLLNSGKSVFVRSFHDICNHMEIIGNHKKMNWNKW